MTTRAMTGLLEPMYVDTAEVDCEPNSYMQMSAQKTTKWSHTLRRTPTPKSKPVILLQSRLFHLLSCTITVINAVVIGIDQAARIHGNELAVLVGLQWGFIAYYFMELVLHLWAEGMACFQDDWVKFDAGILICEILGEFILGRAMGPNPPVLIFRTLKLAPLVRTLRPMVEFRVLRVLVMALLNCSGIMIHTLLLLFLFLYVFSILGVEFIGHDDKLADLDDEDLATRYFGSLTAAMLTLLQFVCLDSIGRIWRPLVLEDPLLGVYFMAVVLVLPFVLMKLVTGVIVSRTQEEIEIDMKEVTRTRKAKLLASLQRIFCRLDQDRNGRITLEEILDIELKDMRFLCEHTNISDVFTLFSALDPEETGALDVDEFCEGVWRLAATNYRIETARMTRQVEVVSRRLKEAKSSDVSLHEVLSRILQANKGMLEAVRSQRCGGAKPSALRSEPLRGGTPHWEMSLVLGGEERFGLTAPTE